MITDSKARVGPWAGSWVGKSREPFQHHHQHHHHYQFTTTTTSSPSPLPVHHHASNAWGGEKGGKGEVKVQACEQSQLSEASQAACGMPYP